jgi:hypothetical protein
MLVSPDSVVSPRSFAPSAYYFYGVRVKGGLVEDENKPYNAMRVIREKDWKYVEIEGGNPLLFDMANDLDERVNLAGSPEHTQRCKVMREVLFKNFSWDEVHARLAVDRKRLPQFLSGIRPTTPNQYMLKDGRVFDAESGLYSARWLYIPPEAKAGIIPQQFG